MPVAPPKPEHRSTTRWDPWCWLDVQVATLAPVDDPHAGYWQPTQAEPGDPRYTVWQADSVTPPGDDAPRPHGYGEWIAGGGAKFDPNWDNIAWSSVHCDLASASFSTGSAPWEWNASPGNGTLTLLDVDHEYFPLGNMHGPFDDIGVNTPVRVVAHLTADFNDGTNRLAERVLITGVIRRIEHTIPVAGPSMTTVVFSEPHVLYGRVNREAVTVPQEYLEQRFRSIVEISDDPQTGLLPAPDTTYGARRYDANPNYPPNGTLWNTYPLAAGAVSSDLWSEMAKAANSLGLVAAIRLYPSHPSAGPGNGTPKVYAMPPLVPNNNGGGNVDFYGTDTRIVSPDCSPEDTTAAPYPLQGNPARVKIENSPIDLIGLGHDDEKLANVVSIAAAGGSAVVQTDQASFDRWYRHSYQRHDLVFDPTVVGLNGIIAWRFLARLAAATFDISDCSYTMDSPRDFEFAVGAVPSRANGPDHPPVEPGRWMKLDWGFVTADLRVTQIQHQITPNEWRVTHSYEVHNPLVSPEGS